VQSVPIDLYATLLDCASEIGNVVLAGEHEGYSGGRETQYFLDQKADAVALRHLHGAGLRVISEESGSTGTGDLVCVVDPIDGSTNCDRGIPFYATSLAVLRDGELVAGLVKNQATGTVFYAEAGSGAARDGNAIRPSAKTEFSEAIVAFSGMPFEHLGWAQNRALGAASLEICLVADGSLDVYSIARRTTLNPWDYLAGLLIVEEAGAVYADYDNEPLVITEMTPRRPVFAGNPTLIDFMLRQEIV
jgi:fructose-1,6-bisphosphatase/inositol monophosphatase family enzyme